MQNSNNLSKNDPIMFNIICRSLFILKSKFEIYKNEINKLYTKYFVKDKNNYNNNTFKIIKKDSFKNLLEEICNLINISIFKITSMNELFMSNFIPEIRNEERQNKAIEKINNYITDKIRKYNQIYFTRKIKPLIEINKIEEISDDYTNYYPIGEYDKNGNLINIFEQIKKLNEENYIKSNDLTLEEEYELNLKEDNILYIETLPMIIADFINLHSNYVIINTEINDSKLNNDIKNLFDGEIMKRIEKEYSNLTEKIVNLPQTFEDEMKVKNILERQNEINKKIKIYENLLKQKKKSGENIIFLQEFVNQLKEEKEKFNKNISKEQKEIIKRNKINEKLKIIKNNNKENNLNNDKTNNDNIITITKTEETIENNLSTENLSEETEDNLYEIFLFYANQQNEKLLSPTFDEMAYRKVRLNFDEFSKFLIDFEVKIQKEKLIELFNKNSTNKLMSFEQFKNIFLKMGLPMNNYRKEKLFKKKKLYDVKLKLEKNKKNDSIQNKLNELKMNENTIEEEYKRLNNLDYKGVKEEFDDYIGINQPNIYREKMKGFLDLKEREIDFENKLIFKKPHLINISNKFKLKKNSHKKLFIDKEKKLEEFKNNNNIIENNENEIYNQKDKIKENKFFYVSKKEKEELIKKEEEKQKLILLKKKLEEEELEKKRKLEEEERQRKKALLEEEKRKYIFSFPRIEKSSLKDIEIDEKDEKLLLIDSESENSDIEILNRFGNVKKNNSSQIIEKENDNKIENQIENNNNNINNELENNKNNNNYDNNNNNNDNNDNKNINNKVENNDNNNDNNDNKNIINKLENNDNNNKLENNNTSNNNNIYEKELINLNRNETPKTIDNNKIKKIIIKSPSNPLYTRNNHIYYKNNVYSPNKYISNNINQSSKTERTKPLIKAGEKIISSNYDSFNEQLTHFYKPINKKINKEEKINKTTFLKKSIQKIKNNIK